MGMFDWLTGNYDPQKVYDDMGKNVNEINTDFQQNTGEQMFNPNSAYNQRQLSSMRQGSMDQIAQQGMMNQRQSAAGQGFGANQRQQQFNAKAGDQLHQGFNQHMQQAANTGTGLLGQAMQGNMKNMDFQQSRASAYAQQGAQNASNVGGMWQGLLGAGLGGWAGGGFKGLGGLFGGGGGESGGIINAGFNSMTPSSGFGGMLNQQPGYQMQGFGGGALPDGVQ